MVTKPRSVKKEADTGVATLNEAKKTCQTIDNKACGTTRVYVKFDAGFGNHLYIRGEGANLSWNKGIQLKNIKADEWVWETSQPFHQCKFKVLINDKIYETGNDRLVNNGSTMSYTPQF